MPSVAEMRRRKRAGLSDEEMRGMSEEEMEEDDFGALKPGSFDTKSAASEVGKEVGRGGSAEDIVGGGLIASGNPYAMAGGVGLKVLAARQRRMKQEEDLKYRAKLERISRQQAAIGRLVDISRGLKNL